MRIVPDLRGVGYDVPVAQSKPFKLRPYHAASVVDDDTVI